MPQVDKIQIFVGVYLQKKQAFLHPELDYQCNIDQALDLLSRKSFLPLLDHAVQKA
ncbi:MAG: hypothetical protein IBX48_10305 [Thiomicrospira sp.]|uniref:hypothetical protein n=1 Tax=Thiomicrospira sp. TaxID=935 RepID=UPI001A01A05A|nr:hypothetical protein [Thiomicrospira sp.]MBE0494712.1 hypothetical protein [Thiomicrospira sp.]